jgi:hypothetical protein
MASTIADAQKTSRIRRIVRGLIAGSSRECQSATESERGGMLAFARKVTMREQFLRRVLRKVSPELTARLAKADYSDRLLMPRALSGKDLKNFVPDTVLPFDDLPIDLGAQANLVRSWKTKGYGSLFDEIRADPAINPSATGRGYVDNGYYLTPDAEIYAAMILDFQPRRIVEVGSGFSTLIARKAVARLSKPCEIVVIDPQPRTAVEKAADRFLRSYVEDADLSQITIDSSTLFFIDSSHIARAGGDIPVLYNQLLPFVAAGALVHVHDIYIPYDYPFMYQDRLYTEQYVLRALLSHSARYRILLSTYYLSRTHPEVMRETFGEDVFGRGIVPPAPGRDTRFYGESFWFSVQGNSNRTA